jgi:hypothetical protein
MEEKMNPAHKSNDHHFYPEGHTEKFFMKFQTAPSKPVETEAETGEEATTEQENESSFQSKTWTKTTDAWV